MRGAVVGIIEGLNEILVQFPEHINVERGQTVEVNIPKEMRSKNANRLYWELNGRLAQALNVSGETIYRKHIKDIACRECYFMLTDAVDKFRQLWTSGHLGRFIETRESKEEGKTIVLAYYGSSDFSKMQMKHLIDNIMQDCEEHDVPTFNQDEVNEAVARWASGRSL